MGIFNFWKREAVHTDSPKVTNVEGADYKAHVVYANTPDTAMKIAAVYRAVNLISSGLASLRLEYKRKDRAKNYFKLYDTASGKVMNWLLGYEPNARMNSFTMFKNLVSGILLRGNAYIYPDRDDFGMVKAFYLLSPESVVYDVYANLYHVADTVNGIYRTLNSQEILHFKNVSRDGGYTGVSTIRYAAQTLGIAATSDTETLKRFATGGRFKAILKNNGSVRGFGEYQDEQLKGHGTDLQDAINRGDDILVVKGDADVSPLSMTSADMQFLESRKFTIREIARFFNVPPSKLMDDSNSNYKSVEVSNIAFYAEALQPIVEEIQREFAAKLLNVATYQDYKFSFNLKSLYALDLESKGNWDSKRLQNGQVSVNDLRRENDIEPVDKGDEVYLSVNFAPLGSAKLSGESSQSGEGNKIVEKIDEGQKIES